MSLGVRKERGIEERKMRGKEGVGEIEGERYEGDGRKEMRMEVRKERGIGEGER